MSCIATTLINYYEVSPAFDLGALIACARTYNLDLRIDSASVVSSVFCSSRTGRRRARKPDISESAFRSLESSATRFIYIYLMGDLFVG